MSREGQTSVLSAYYDDEEIYRYFVHLFNGISTSYELFKDEIWFNFKFL